MRSTVGKFALVAALLAIISAPAGATPDETITPRCADIIAGGGILIAEPGEGDATNYSVDFGIELKRPSCRHVSYILVVLEDLSPGAAILARVSKHGDGFETPFGTGALGFFIPGADDDNLACVYAITKIRAVLDRAPDTGCLDITESSPGGRPFN